MIQQMVIKTISQVTVGLFPRTRMLFLLCQSLHPHPPRAQRPRDLENLTIPFLISILISYRQVSRYSSLLYTVYTLLYTIYTLLYTVYTLPHTVYSLLYTVYSLPHTVYSLLYTVYFLPPGQPLFLSSLHCIYSSSHCIFSSLRCIFSSSHRLFSSLHCIFLYIRLTLVLIDNILQSSLRDIQLSILLLLFSNSITVSFPSTTHFLSLPSLNYSNITTLVLNPIFDTLIFLIFLNSFFLVL